MQQSSKSYNVGLRLAMNAGAGVKGTFVTQEAAGFKGEKSQASSNPKSASRALIVFYSWSGNTRGVAREIKKQTGFDMVELELVKPYSDDYNTVLKQAQNDQHKQARPALKKKPDAKKWADYETRAQRKNRRRPFGALLRRFEPLERCGQVAREKRREDEIMYIP